MMLDKIDAIEQKNKMWQNLLNRKCEYDDLVFQIIK